MRLRACKARVKMIDVTWTIFIGQSAFGERHRFLIPDVFSEDKHLCTRLTQATVKLLTAILYQKVGYLTIIPRARVGYETDR